MAVLRISGNCFSGKCPIVRPQLRLPDNILRECFRGLAICNLKSLIGLVRLVKPYRLYESGAVVSVGEKLYTIRAVEFDHDGWATVEELVLVKVQGESR